MRKQNGITLISLIITIIIMLILAGVSLSMVMGDGSMLEQANSAVTKTEVAEVQEYVDLATAGNKMAKYSGIGLKSKTDIVIEMAEQGLITDAQKNDVINNGADLEVDGVKIEFTELEESYNAVTPAAYELSGTWTFKDTVDIQGGLDEFGEQIDNVTYYSANVNFTSGSYDYISMSLDKTSDTLTLFYDLEDMSDPWYRDGSWGSNTGYKVVNFGTEPQTVSGEFYNWFIANATKN